MSSVTEYDIKERVRQAVDIVELVGSYLQLRREGRNYKALCPWHDDTRPSLHVNPERQSFKCWVCDIGGDIFSFVMKMENVEFPEALAMLAERAGISLKPARSSSGRSDTDEKRALYQAMAWAEERFYECLLNAPEAEPARRYLADRQISADSVERFRLGYAPDRWDWLIKQRPADRNHDESSRNRRPDHPQRWRRTLRSVPRPSAVSHSRRAGPAGRSGRPGAAAGNC